MTTILLLAGAGFVLLLTEVFLPGGVLGILGAIALIAATVVGYTQFGALPGTMLLAGLATLTFTGFCVWMKIFPKTAIGRRLTLEQTPPSEDANPATALIGLEGTALTALRPAGKALIGERRVDVVTNGLFIEPNSPVVVVAADGTRIVVRGETPTEISGRSTTKDPALSGR